MDAPTNEDLMKRLKVMYVITVALALISLVFFFYGRINYIEANKQAKLAVVKAQELEQCALEARKQQQIAEKNAEEAMKQYKRAVEASNKASRK
jgi:preprotein translocase subunit SecF